MYGMKFRTIKDAAQSWVSQFNAMPSTLIERAYFTGEDAVTVLTGDLECRYCGSTDVTDVIVDGETGADKGFCNSCERERDLGVVFDLPMWGTLWTFGESIDEDWARENLNIMQKCGFWVYEAEEIGLFFGINGAGYDFYEEHWIPLYKARGLQWHEPTADDR